MAIEIFSVSSCINTNKEWKLVIHYFDLKNIKEPLRKLCPLPEIPRLPIGAKIEKDGIISKSGGKSKQVVFPNFNSGKIISIEELTNRLYLFEVQKEVMIDTKLYIINNGESKPIVFFCYELFRTFLCLDNRIIPYLFQFDVLESFIDKSEISEVGGKRFLYLELNGSFPKSFLRDQKFLENYIFVLYNNSIREYWKSIQANSTISKSNFSFNSIGLKKLDLVCRVNEYKDFTLVYNIEEIISNLEFPFDELELVHASFKDKNKKKQPNVGRKKGRFDIKLPTSHFTDNDKQETNSSEYSESLSVLPLNFRFDRRMEIKRMNLASGDNSSNTGSNSKHSFPKLSLKDLNVGFNNKENDGKEGSLFLNLTRDEGFNEFDYSEIPDGLVFFSKAVGIIANTLKLSYTYEIKQFSINSTFSKIGDTDRKALIIKIHHNPFIYIVEIDSSDDKYISTLMLANLHVSDKNSFFENVLKMAGERNGTWPEEYINNYCEFINIRHPKLTKKLKKLPIEKRNDIYIETLTYKIIKILV